MDDATIHALNDQQAKLLFNQFRSKYNTSCDCIENFLTHGSHAGLAWLGLAWLGNADLRAVAAGDSDDLGPILGALKTFTFGALYLLSDHSVQKTRAYAQWLGGLSSVPVTSHQAKLTSPTSFEEIFRAAVGVIEEVKRASPAGDLSFHLSPGTPDYRARRGRVIGCNGRPKG